MVVHHFPTEYLIDYADIIYEKPYNKLFWKNIEIVQHKGYLAVRGAIQRTSQENFFKRIGLECLNENDT